VGVGYEVDPQVFELTKRNLSIFDCHSRYPGTHSAEAVVRQWEDIHLLRPLLRQRATVNRDGVAGHVARLVGGENQRD